MVRQSRLGSALESILNVGSGFLISFVIWNWIAGPLFGLNTSPSKSFGIVALFTAVSVVRSYLWRRFFEHRIKCRADTSEKTALLSEDQCRRSRHP